MVEGVRVCGCAHCMCVYVLGGACMCVKCVKCVSVCEMPLPWLFQWTNSGGMEGGGLCECVIGFLPTLPTHTHTHSLLHTPLGWFSEQCTGVYVGQLERLRRSSLSLFDPA